MRNAETAAPGRAGESPLCNPQFLDRVVRKEGPRLLRRLRRRFAAIEDLEDIVQETLITAWQRQDLLPRSEGAVRAWLWRVAHNTAVDSIRRREARSRREKEWSGMQVPELPREESLESPTAALERALLQLPPESASLVVAVHLRGGSVAGAATRIGMTDNAARVRLHRARRRLKDLLEPVLRPPVPMVATSSRAGRRSGPGERRGAGRGVVGGCNAE